MGGRNRDTLRLIPVGIIYALHGFLIVAFPGGTMVQALALVLTALGMTAAIVTRKTTQIRAWVI